MNRWPMTAVMTCSALASPILGASDESQYVARHFGSLLERLQDSRSVGIQALMDDLHALEAECSDEGWDGQDARAISSASIELVARLLKGLAVGTNRLSLGVDANGWVTMAWHHSPRWTLSVSVTGDGWLHYAALLGSERHFGTVAMGDRLPSVVATLAERVSRA